jgi:hypothetical protein
MSHLIQGFYRYYQICTAHPFQCFMVITAAKGFVEANPIKIVKLLSRKQKQKMVKPFIFGRRAGEYFLRLPLADLVASRLVCDDWAAVYDSKHFQGKCNRTEACIVINNHNLDMWGFGVISKSWFLMKVPCDWESLGMKTLGIKASCDGLFLVARSDLTLYVVNPLTAQCKRFPSGICWSHIFPLYEHFLDGSLMQATLPLVQNCFWL